MKTERNSMMILKRAAMSRAKHCPAMVLVLMLTMFTPTKMWAQDIPLKTVVLKAGEGEGSDVSFNSHDPGRFFGENTYDGANVSNGQFYCWTNNDELRIKIPDCPDSFNAPPGKRFLRWKLLGTTFLPGDYFVIGLTKDQVTLTAEWEWIPTKQTITTADQNGIGRWLGVPDNAVSGDIVNVKVFFNDGNYEAGYRMKTITVSGADGSSFQLPVDEKYSGNGNHYYIAAFTMPRTNVTLTANWIAPVDHSITLTNDGHGTATASPSSAVPGTYVTLTPVPYEGYLFKEWQVIAGNVRIETIMGGGKLLGYKFNMGMEDVEIKAFFRPVVQATIHFDAGEGTVVPASLTTGTNGKLPLLPTPTREGWKFDGWYTATAGGEKVTTETIIEEDTTLYARWYQGSHYTLEQPDIVELTPDMEYSPVAFSISELELAQNPNGNTPSRVRLYISHGTLINQADNTTSIPFYVDNDQGGSLPTAVTLNYYTDETKTFYIKVNGDDWDAAEPGTYRGTLSCQVYYVYQNPTFITELLEERAIPVTVTIENPPSVILADNEVNDLTEYDGQRATLTLLNRTFYTNGTWQTLCLPFSLSSLTGTPLDGFTVKELDTENLFDEHVTGLDNDGTLYLNFKDATCITAGKPYVVKKLNANQTRKGWAQQAKQNLDDAWTTIDSRNANEYRSDANVEDPVFENVTINSVAPTEVKSGDDAVTFVGSYNPVNITGMNNSIVFLGESGTLCYPAAGDGIGAMRSYFQIGNRVRAKQYVMNFGDEVITGFFAESNESGIATGMDKAQGSKFKVQSDEWYTIDGRKLCGKPTKKGVYIHNGKKAIVN